MAEFYEDLIARLNDCLIFDGDKDLRVKKLLICFQRAGKKILRFTTVNYYGKVVNVEIDEDFQVVDAYGDNSGKVYGCFKPSITLQSWIKSYIRAEEKGFTFKAKTEKPKPADVLDKKYPCWSLIRGW